MTTDTRRVAIYAHPKYMYSMIFDDGEHSTADLVRWSDWVAVDFVQRPTQEIVPEQIAAIDAEIAKATAQFAKTLEELKTQKANLLALTQDHTELAT